MPVMGSSNLIAKKDMVSKKWTNGDTIVSDLVGNIVGKKKLLITSNFFFSHNVFKSCLLLMRQNEYIWSKGLTLHYTTLRVNPLPNNKF